MKWKGSLVLLSLVFLAGGIGAQEAQQTQRTCKTREEIRHTHRLEYRAADGTYRGCQVSSEFYFQIKKMNRGSPRKYNEICEEGDPRFTPKIGDSYEICP